MISKESILSKTHYGLNIYSHILRFYYPDEVVLRLVGRDCGLCRNPFNANKQTLHIFIQKENILGSVLDKEIACHEDSTNAIPAGDAFDFAELHYKQQGDELLQTLNKEMFLHIGEKSCQRVQNSNEFEVMPSAADFGRSQQRNFYRSAQKFSICSKISQTQSPPLGDLGGFSFFKSPISNVIPHKTVTLLQIYNAIKGDYYKGRTQKLRAILSPLSCGEVLGGEVARKFKSTNFDYCTFSGTFTTRNDKALIKHSGLLCLDFDHLQNLNDLRSRLLADEYLDTQLLFVSPSGNGLKWIISIDTTQTTHADYFISVSNYLKATYNVEADKSGKDISRACFLPHDPQAYINSKFISL